MSNVAEFKPTVQPQIPEPASVHRQLDRSGVAQSIAQMLLALYCREEEVRPIRLSDMMPKESEKFRQAGELIVQMILHPDLERTAVMAAADIVCRGEYEGAEEMYIVDGVSKKKAAYIFNLSTNAIRAYKNTLVFQSPDPFMDTKYDDLVQVLESDGLVIR